MVLILCLLISLELLVLNNFMSKKINTRFSPISIMTIIWIVLMFLSIVFADASGLYHVGFETIIFSAIFLNSIIISNIFFARRTKNDSSSFSCNGKIIFIVQIVFFILYVFSSIIYFYELKDYGINISSIFNSFRDWKILITKGDLNENKLIFIGRNLNFIGTIISLSVIVNTGNRRKLSLLVLVLYFFCIIIYPRRDIIVCKTVYILVPFIINYSKNYKKLFLLLSFILVSFIISFIFISQSLSWTDKSLFADFGPYSFGAFNSFQKAYDFGYESNSSLVGGNTFYFVYMILKYINPNLTPPSIILDFYDGGDSVNVYTSLIAPYVDSNGSTFVFIGLLVLYGIFIGAVSAFIFNYYSSQKNISSIILYSTVFSCSIRSFYNPTFSYAELTIGIFFSFLFYIIIDSRTKSVGNCCSYCITD